LNQTLLFDKIEIEFIMKVVEAERLINKWRCAKDRIDNFNRLVKVSEKSNWSSPKITVNGEDLVLTENEFRMIKNILANTIIEAEANYREQLKEQLNIQVEA
jgi:hypothetical protein